jgi:ABC-type Fe3+-siderophore transport system permease subunit
MAVIVSHPVRTHRITVTRPVLLVGLTVTALALTVYSLSVTGTDVPLWPAVRAAFGANNQYKVLIQQSQLPRVLLCWLVGISLGVAGGVTQAVIRNPLASPEVIGVSKGASVGAAMVLLVLPNAPAALIPIAAFAGGMLAFAAIYVFAYKRGVSPVRLALTGIAIGAVCDSLLRFMLVKWPTNINAALVWMVGSLYGRTRIDLLELLPWVLVLVPLILFYAHRLDVLGLGDDLALGLGERVERTRFITLLLAVSLASAAVAVAGAIGFVGLVAPHIARRLVGGRHLHYLPVSALVGVLLMLAADTVGRGIHPPLDIPAGLVTAFIGGPYFLFLLAKIVK